MSQFPSRYERGIPNVAGSRPRGLRNIVGGTIGTSTPDGAPRVSVAPIAPDTTAGNLAEILNRGSQVAAQSLAIYNRNRELADQQYLGRGSELAEDALPEIEARIAELDTDGLDQFDIDAEVTRQLGEDANEALRRGFRERANLSLSRAVQQRRTFLDQNARRDATADIVSGLSTADQDDDPQQRLADATTAFFRANPDATDADFARSILPVVQEAAKSGNRRLFDLLSGPVQENLPEQYGDASRLLSGIEDDRLIAEEKQFSANARQQAALVRLGRRTQDSYFQEFGDALSTRPTLDEEIRKSFVETGNVELEKKRNQLRAAAERLTPDYFEREEALADLPDPDGKNEELISRTRSKFQTGLARQAQERANRIESEVGRLVRDGNLVGAADLVTNAIDQQLFTDQDQANRVLSDVQEAAYRQNLTIQDATTLADPTIPGNAATFTASEPVTLADGREISESGGERAKDAYNAVLADQFGPGRSPLREHVAGGTVDEAAIERNLSLIANSGHKPDNLVAETNGAMASASESAPNQPQEVLRAVDVARRLKARGVSIIEGGTNGQILRHALALTESGVVRSDAEAVAAAKSAVTRIGAGEIDDYVQRIPADDLTESLPKEFKDSAYAKNTIGDAAWQYQTFFEMDQEQALKAAQAQFKLDHAKVGDKWINTTRMQLDDGSIAAGSRMLQLYAQSRGLEDADTHVDNRTGLMYVPNGGPEMPTLDSEDIRVLNLYSSRINAYKNLRGLAERLSELDKFDKDYLLDVNAKELGPYRDDLKPILNWIRDNHDRITGPRGMSFGEAVGGSLAGRSPI